MVNPAFFGYFEERSKSLDYSSYDLAEPEEMNQHYPVVQATYSTLLLLSLVFLFTTAVTEPGIIPRNSDDLLEGLPSEIKGAIAST